MDCELIISAERKAVKLEISGDAQLHEKNAEVIVANTALDECLHGYVTGAGAVDNMTQAVKDFGEIKAAIEEKGVELSDTPDGYADLIRNELTAGADINPAWTDWRYFYAYNRIDFVNKLKYSDTRNGTTFTSMFAASSKLTLIPPIDTRNGTEFTNMFFGCNNLETIGMLNMSSAVSCTNEFSGCGMLQNITFEGEIPISISVTSKRLSTESVNSIVTHLKDYSGTEQEFTCIVKFDSGVWETFNATECTEGYDTWYDYVQAKGWNVS